MNNKEGFKFLVSVGILKQEEDIARITLLVNGLIDSLYIPTLNPDAFSELDKTRLEKFEVSASEPVNWGANLHVCDVVKDKDSDFYTVTIEEASPDDCSSLCEYLEKFMLSNGWTIKVITEW